MINTPWNFTLIILIIFEINYGRSNLNKGDACSFEEDSTFGECRFASMCKSSNSQLALENSCGFQGSQLLVCCKPEDIIQRTTTPIPDFPAPEIKTGLQKSDRVAGEISKAKCKEYAEYAYDQGQIPVLSRNAGGRLKTLECYFEQTKLIAGGTLAVEHEFPHMALLGYKDGTKAVWDCGGSLISENFVLTAGHCVEHRELGSAILVRLGLTNKFNQRTMQERRVAEIIHHPEYKTKYHDIGLLKLSEAFNLNPYVRPACLQRDRSIHGNEPIAAGWGPTEYDGFVSDDLYKIVLEFFDVEHCNETYKEKILKERSFIKDGIKDDLMICAGSSTERKDTCKGDSGGPLQVHHDHSDGLKCMYDVIGVTAFGKPCGLSANSPGIYTRVSTFIKWIEDHVWPVEENKS